MCGQIENLVFFDQKQIEFAQQLFHGFKIICPEPAVKIYLAVETLGKLVDGTLIMELYVWYIIAGILIGAWAFFYLALAAAKRNTIAFRIFGVIIGLAVLWLGIVSAYDHSYGFTDTINIPQLIVPAVLLVSQIAICIFLVVFRKKER